jgi:ribonuclease Z
MNIQHKNITLQAISTGGQYTSLILPTLKMGIDMGIASESAMRCNRVFITHPHIDHIAGIIRHCSSREMMSMEAPTYYIGEEHRNAFEDMMNSWRRLNRSFLPYKLEVMYPNRDIEINNKYFIRAFRSIHKVPCLGYMLYETRRKLKSEFLGTPGHEIAQLREEGIDLYNHIEVPVFAYTGDTTIDVMKREESLRRCQFLAIEITFFDERVTPENARKNGHIHIEDVVKNAHLFENEHILVMHLSNRHTPEEARQAIQKYLPTELSSRITVLPNHSPFKALQEKYQREK